MNKKEIYNRTLAMKWRPRRRTRSVLQAPSPSKRALRAVTLPVRGEALKGSKEPALCHFQGLFKKCPLKNIYYMLKIFSLYFSYFCCNCLWSDIFTKLYYYKLSFFGIQKLHKRVLYFYYWKVCLWNIFIKIYFIKYLWNTIHIIFYNIS